MKVHLDTDLGGDPDDVCALLMLLGWPDVEVVAVTTVDDPDGRRAGYAARCLELAGHGDVPVAAGAGSSLTSLRPSGWLPEEARYWPEPVAPVTSAPGGALDLLARSVVSGATVVAIGPYTNLALLELVRPGALAGAPVVVMGGWIDPPVEGFPAWGPDRDWNVQCDTRAAEVVAGTADLTLVTLPAAISAHLRRRDLDVLRAIGPLGELMARQAEAYASDHDRAEFARAYSRLPEDLLNFHWDPVAGAIAVGWDGATVLDRRIRPAIDASGVLRFVDDPAGPGTKVVTAVDGDAFSARWLEAVRCAAEAASSAA